MWHYIVLAMGWLIGSIYELVKNYGVAIILFTLLIKLILMPLNIKSQKAMKKQQKIQPLVAEIQKKYANDKNKMQQEMAKVYKENGVSMMGGCLPLLLQMPILIALYQAISRPLTYMFNLNWTDETAGMLTEKITQIRDAAAAAGENLGNLANTSAQDLFNQSQIQITNWANHAAAPLNEWAINFKFLGLDLSQVPSTALSCFNDIQGNMSIIMLLIIPVLAILSSVAQSKISMKLSGQDKNKSAANEQAQSMSKMMTWMMPVMTGYFTFILPAGVGLYWIISGLITIAQQIGLNYYFDKKGEGLDVRLPESKRQHQHGKKSKKR